MENLTESNLYIEILIDLVRDERYIYDRNLWLKLHKEFKNAYNSLKNIQTGSGAQEPVQFPFFKT